MKRVFSAPKTAELIRGEMWGGNWSDRKDLPFSELCLSPTSAETCQQAKNTPRTLAQVHTSFHSTSIHRRHTAKDRFLHLLDEYFRKCCCRSQRRVLRRDGRNDSPGRNDTGHWRRICRLVPWCRPIANRQGEAGGCEVWGGSRWWGKRRQ